jgi:hypothetical protein
VFDAFVPHSDSDSFPKLSQFWELECANLLDVKDLGRVPFLVQTIKERFDEGEAFKIGFQKAVLADPRTFPSDLLFVLAKLLNEGSLGWFQEWLPLCEVAVLERALEVALGVFPCEVWPLKRGGLPTGWWEGTSLTRLVDSMFERD